ESFGRMGSGMGKGVLSMINWCRERCLRLLATDIRFTPADQLQPASITIVQKAVSPGPHLPLHHDRHINIIHSTARRPREFCGSNANHRVAVPVHPERFAKHCRISAEPPLPQTVTDDDDWMRPWRTIFFRQKKASERRPHAKHRKIIARDDLPNHAFGLATLAQAEGSLLVSDQSCEHIIAVA